MQDSDNSGLVLMSLVGGGSVLDWLNPYKISICDNKITINIITINIFRPFSAGEDWLVQPLATRKLDSPGFKHSLY